MLTLPEVESAVETSRPVPLADPVHARMSFPFTRRLYPLGFPADFSSNCEEVLDAATESWGAFTGLFETQPLRIQIGVLNGNSTECPPATNCLVQQHLFSFIADSENYGIADMAQGFTAVWLTKEAIKHRGYLRFFFLECAAISLIATRHATGVHAGCVARNGVGVLLCGDSGAGKTTLSYACAKAGWTYVTDDGSFVVHGRDDLLVVGNCNQIRFRPSATSIFPEIEGRETMQRSEASKPSIEMYPSELQGVQSSQSANAQYFVLLNRRDAINEPLRPYSREVVSKYLRQGRFSPPGMLPLHYATIDRVLQLPILELRYRDLDWALAQLEALVERGHT